MPTTQHTPRLPRPALVVIALLAAVLVAGVVLVSVLGRSQEGGRSSGGNENTPFAMPSVPTPDAGSASCTALAGSLPQQLANGKHPLPKRTLAAPAPKAAAAWGGGKHPVTLRCGVPEPKELTPTSRLLDVSGVQWLEVPAPGPDPDTVTAYAVDRPSYVALTMPSNVGTGPLQNVSAAVSKTMKAAPVHPSGG